MNIKNHKDFAYYNLFDFSTFGYAILKTKGTDKDYH